MNKLNFKWLLFFTIFQIALSGCAANGPIFTGFSEPEKDKALVYIFRPYNFAGAARRAKISINDDPYVQLVGGGYTSVSLAAGEYQFKQSYNRMIGDPAFLKKEREFATTFVAGQTYFVVFNLDAEETVAPSNTIMGSGTLTTVTFMRTFGVINKDIALSELKKCRYQAPI